MNPGLPTAPPRLPETGLGKEIVRFVLKRRSTSGLIRAAFEPPGAQRVRGAPTRRNASCLTGFGAWIHRTRPLRSPADSFARRLSRSNLGGEFFGSVSRGATWEGSSGATWEGSFGQRMSTYCIA